MGLPGEGLTNYTRSTVAAAAAAAEGSERNVRDVPHSCFSLQM